MSQPAPKIDQLKEKPPGCSRNLCGVFLAKDHASPAPTLETPQLTFV